MIRLAILGSAAALALSLPAAAQQYGYGGYSGYDSYGYQNQGYYNNNCDTQRRNNQTAGTVVGAIAGGLLGAAIADDGDDDHYRRRGHHRYSRGWNRGYGYGHGYRRHHRDNDNGDQLAGALIGGVVGAMAGNAIGGSTSTNCTTRAYGPQDNGRYGNMGVAPPTRQAYGQGWSGSTAQPVTHGNSYNQGAYDLRPGEELYGGTSHTSNPAWSDPTYGATTTGYNAGYTAPRDTGECRTVYRGDQPATACNVGGDRWEFVD